MLVRFTFIRNVSCDRSLSPVNSFESHSVLFAVPPQSRWLLRNTLLQRFHAIDVCVSELKRYFTFHFPICCRAHASLPRRSFSRSRDARFGTISEIAWTKAQRRSHTTASAIICSSPSVTMYHLRPASSIAPCGRRFSHVLFNSGLMKRPQPLADNTPGCLSVVRPRQKSYVWHRICPTTYRRN